MRLKPASIRALFLAVVISAQLLTVAITVAGMQRQASDQIRSNASGTLDRLADDIANQTRRFLEPAEAAIELAHNLADAGTLDITSDTNLDEFFQAQLLSNSHLNGLYFGRNDGSFVYVSRTLDGLRSKIIQIDKTTKTVALIDRDMNLRTTRHKFDPADTYDPRARPWYKKAHVAGSLVWTDVYTFFSSGLLGITASVSVQNNDGTMGGVFGVDIDIQQLSEFISNIPNSVNGSAVIVDKHHKTIAYSDADRINSMIGYFKRPSMELIVDFPLLKLFRQSSETDNPFDLPQGTISEFDANDDHHIGVVRPFTLANKSTRWLLLAQAPAEDFSGGLGSILTEKMWALLAIILIPATIAGAMVLRITKPIYRLHQDATVDKLTGALNRAEFAYRLAGMMKNRRAREFRTHLVAIALDLDGFKLLNDRFGHAAGDAVLVEFVTRLSKHVNRNELIGRVGGDEFVMVIRLESTANLLRTIDQIRLDVLAIPVYHADNLLEFGVTAGIAVCQHDDTVDSLLLRADKILIQGKASQKNRCYLAPEAAGSEFCRVADLPADSKNDSLYDNRQSRKKSITSLVSG